MIAVALAVIAGVIAVTCGIVADSNHADTLTFLGVMVKTTAAQIFLAGAICTWALFASLWLFSVGVRRSKERGIELRARKALRARGLAVSDAASDASDTARSAERARSATRDWASASDSEPTIEFDDFGGFGALDHLHSVVEPELGRHVNGGRFYSAGPSSS